MQALLRSEGWSPSGELVGLDEGDPELVYHQSRGGYGLCAMPELPICAR